MPAPLTVELRIALAPHLTRRPMPSVGPLNTAAAVASLYTRKRR